MERLPRVLALGALALVAAGARPSTAEPADPWRQLWGTGADPLWSKYEELFDEPFPVRPHDLFQRAHPFYEVEAFDRAVDLRMAGVSTQVDYTDAAVTLSIYWPGSSSKPLDVAIERGLVRVRPSPAPPQSSSPYRFYANGSRAFSVKVPPDAEASSAKVTRQGDVIRVDFEKRAGLWPKLKDSAGVPN